MWVNSSGLLTALSAYDFGGQDEQSIREQWIYPLLGLLGYGIGTSNPVDIPFKVDLPNPVRAIGHHRFEVDYRPTVHGVGMWIIEAKKPAEDLFSEQHLGQAWSYATHPKIDVPFIALANGRRICVYDITEDDWDEKPVIDIQQAELTGRFAELDAALGARRIAEFVRRRQLRHLRTALFAQLDDEALQQTLDDVQQIVEEARPVVERRRSQTRFEAFQEGMEERDRSAEEVGVWGIGFGCMSPSAPIGAEIDSCVRIIRHLPAENRATALDELAASALVGETVRMTFALRILRLAVCLRLVDDEACGERAREVADLAAHEAAIELSDDPLAAAAHRFELVLPAYLARLFSSQADKAIEQASQFKAHMDVEAWLREDAKFGLGPGAMLARQVEIWFRLVWVNFSPWTVKALDEATAAMRDGFEGLPPATRDVPFGQIGNEFYESHLLYDPLKQGSFNVIRQVADPPYFSSDEPGIHVRSAFAIELLHRHFAEMARP